jgi:hypothetical protein
VHRSRGAAGRLDHVAQAGHDRRVPGPVGGRDHVLIQRGSDRRADCRAGEGRRCPRSYRESITGEMLPAGDRGTASAVPRSRSLCRTIRGFDRPATFNAGPSAFEPFQAGLTSEHVMARGSSVLAQGHWPSLQTGMAHEAFYQLGRTADAGPVVVPQRRHSGPADPVPALGGDGVLGWVRCSRSVVSLDPLPQ